MEIQMTPAQWAALTGYMGYVDIEDDDRIVLMTHAGGNLGMQVITPDGTVVDELELDPKGDA